MRDGGSVPDVEDTPWVGAWQIAGGRRTLTHLIVGDRTVCGRVVPGSARVYATERLPVLCVQCDIERRPRSQGDS